MKDFFGFELSVGDTVVMIDPAALYLTIGTVKEILQREVRIKYLDGETNKYPGEVVKRVLEPADLKLIKFTIGSDQ